MLAVRQFTVAPLILLMLLLSSCSYNNGEQLQQITLPISESYFIFDTIVTVRVYDEKVTSDHFVAIEDVLNGIDELMNRMKSGSEIDVVNRHAGRYPVHVSEETFKVVQAALKFAEQSGGKFEPTIGPLVDLWGIGNEGAKLPNESAIDKTLQLIDFTQVMLDEANTTIYLTIKGMSLDLGAIAKGYAGDRIASYLRSENITSAIIDLGGNIIAMGTKPNDQAWTIGIQDPQQQRGDYVGRLAITDQTVVTSGIYERYFIENGKHYHHILNPTNGYPVDNDLLSVTIVTGVSMDADALSTSAYAMGLEEGLRFIEKRVATEAIFITKDKQVITTSGLLHAFEITNHNYSLVPQKTQ